MTLRATLSSITLAAAFAGGLTLSACDSSSGGGGGVAPQNTNSASVTVKSDDGSATDAISVSDPVGAAGTFGADIAGSLLTIWISGNGSLITGVIDTEVYNLPGAATMGEPPDAAGFVTIVDAMAGSSLISTGGTVVFDQCPKAVGQAFTGRFNNVTMRDEVTSATSTLTGDFNLKVLTKAGELVCKTTTPTTPTDTIGGDGGGGGDEEFPGKGQAQCDNPTCDGPCCPYIPCLSSCALSCEENACQGFDFQACIACVSACTDSCDVSQACLDAAQDVSACESDAGCDQIEDDDASEACLAASCCAELKAAY